MCNGDPNDVAPKIPCEDASMIPARVMNHVPASPGNDDPFCGWFYHPVFCLGDPKQVSIGALEITHEVGGFVPDTAGPCVVSKVSSTL